MKIINRIITFIGAAAVFPVAITQMLFSAVLSIDRSSLLYSGLNMILGKDNEITGSRLGVEKTLIDLVDYWTGKQTSSFDIKEIIANLPPEFIPLKKFVIAAIVFACIGLLITIVVMGCALFTKAYKSIIGLSLGGALCFLMSVILFGQAAKPLLEGTIDVATVVAPMLLDSSSLVGSIASGLLAGSVNVDVLGLGGAVYGPMFILFGVAMWELAYYITLPKEERASKKVKA